MTYEELKIKRDETLSEMDKLASRIEEVPAEEKEEAEKRFNEFAVKADAFAKEIEAREARIAKQDEIRGRISEVSESTAPVVVTAPKVTVKENRADTNVLSARAVAEKFVSKFDKRVGYSIDSKLDLRTIANTATFKSDIQGSGSLGMITPPSELTVLDVVPKLATKLSVISYIQSKGTATGGATTVAQGALKPSGTNDFDKILIPVEKIAVVEAITDEILDDETSLKSFIENLLTIQVRTVLETQIMSGNGATPNLRGILTTAGIGSYTAGASEDFIVSVRKGKTLVRESNLMPDSVVLNPADYEQIELAGFAGATVPTAGFANNVPRLFGLNVIESNSVAEGTALVGSFKQGTELWIRDDVKIDYSDSHNDFFGRNMQAIRAEVRAGLVVKTPKAFCKVTFA